MESTMWKALLVLCISLSSLCAGQGQIAPVNGIHIWYDTFGNKQDPALLLLMGGCCQGVIWHEDFCKQLADAGFYVIRYDHRDTGLSTCFDFDNSPYGLIDMAHDALGVLDAVGVFKAHLFGVSLGSMLSELIAAEYPNRVLSLLIIGGSCEIRPMNRAFAHLPIDQDSSFSPPASHYLAWMKEFLALTPQTEEEKLAQRIEGWQRLNGFVIPLDEEKNREIHTEFLSRLRYPQGIVNHVRMLNTPQSEELVRTIPYQVKTPTVILQGSEDPIFAPDHGKALSQAIEGSEYLLVEGMGHVPSDHFYPLYKEILKRQAKL